MPEAKIHKINQVIKVSLITNIVLTLLKAGIGLLAGSYALLSDALHSASDVITTVVAYVGIKISHTPADSRHPYGHARFEAVAAKIMAIILMLTAGLIGYASLQKIKTAETFTPGISALIIAALSIATKEALFRYVYKTGKSYQSQVLIADAWHNRSDALSSMAALIGIGGARLGFTWADPAAGALVAALILKVALDIYIESINDLIDTAPDDETLLKIRQACLSTKGVINIDAMRARKVSQDIYLDISIAVAPNITVQCGHAIAEDVAYNISHQVTNAKDILVHVNPYFSEKKEATPKQ